MATALTATRTRRHRAFFLVRRVVDVAARGRLSKNTKRLTPMTESRAHSKGAIQTRFVKIPPAILGRPTP